MEIRLGDHFHKNLCWHGLVSLDAGPSVFLS